MSWIFPIALGGGLLALGPVVIHILFRWRYRVVPFAAMRFLLESRRRSRQRVRLEELLLILLRVLACVLAGLMLADVRSSAWPVGQTAPTAHLFVLDDSLSMGQVVRAETLYRRAAAEVLRRVSQTADGDWVAVVSACQPGGGGPASAAKRLVSAAEARGTDFAARLKASKPTDLRADFPAALKAAAALVQTDDRMPVRLYVLSDFRQADVSGADAAAALRSAFAALKPHETEVLLLDFGLPCRNNLTVETVAVGRNVVVAGVSAPVRVTVRNTGTAAAAATRLEVSTGEAALGVQPVPALAPGDAAPVEFACTFKSAGSAALEVSLPADDLPADSRAAKALEVQDALRALVLDGTADPGGPQSASFALAAALDPSGTGAFGRRVDVRAAETWAQAASLAAYDVVILANVPQFAPARRADGRTVYPVLEALEEYVRAGGGLAIFVGDGVRPAFYNGPMYADGQGLSPLVLAEAQPRQTPPDQFVRLDAASVADTPMLRVFSRRGADFSRFVRFYEFVSALDPSAGVASAQAPQVLARFDNGMPAVARRACGKGVVVMWYSSADTKWTNWPKDLSFLPAMNDLAWELARPAQNRFDDVAGRTIGYTLPPRLSGTISAVLKTPAYPAEDVHSLALRDDGRQRTIAYPEPAHAGLYELTLTLADRTRHRVLFSRRPDPRESDLAKASEAQVRAAVGRTCTYLPNLALRPAPQESRPVRSYWWAFLGALLAVLILETVLGLRFGHYRRTALDAGERAGRTP